uniref:Terminase large subunit n=1 Tax=Hot spring virus BHS2 TaxID=2024352 RepID=A0A2U7PAK0_9VIRU|nr:hypothetical protein [Hot spring virus BHS2]
MNATTPRFPGYLLAAPEGEIAEKYATFVMLGEPSYIRRYTEVHFVGAVGTAKTSALCDSIIISALEYPGARIALVRDYREYLYKSSYQTLIERAKSLVKDGLFEPIVSRDMVRVWAGGKDNPTEASEIHLFGLDSPKAADSLVGNEWFRIYVDQAERVEESLVAQAFLRLRQKVYHKATGELGFNCMKLTSNLDKGRNWIWRRCVPGSRTFEELPDMYEREVEGEVHGKRVKAYRLYIRGHYGENKSINPLYDTAVLLAGTQAKRFITDEPISGSGLVFPDFNEEIHGFETSSDFANLPVYVGLDPGVRHPTYACAGVVRPDGPLEIVREYMWPLPDRFGEPRSAKQHAQAIARMLNDMHNRGAVEFRVFADPTLWRRDHDLSTAADDYLEAFSRLPFEVALIPAVRDRRNSIERGVSRIQDRLLGRDAFGTPLLRISRRDCPNAFAMFGEVSYDQVSRDVPFVVDVFDGVRYLVMNVPDSAHYQSRERESDYRPQGLMWA